MMEVTINATEWYPVYLIETTDNPFYKKIVISDELYKKYEQVMNDFSELQTCLENLEEKQVKK